MKLRESSMVLQVSNEPMLWPAPAVCLPSNTAPQQAPSPMDNMRTKLRYRPASIKYNRRRKAPGKNHLPTAFGLKMNQCLLSTVGDWDFNIFTLDKLTNGRSLFHILLHLFQEHNLIKTFRLDIVKLMRCITLIEEGYHSSNPYHNAVHAADVVQAMHCYLQEAPLARALTPLERLTSLIAAATHDLDHPGVNQAFLIATSNHLAALYSNCSVLENHHWRSAVGILRESGMLDHLDASLWTSIESQLRSLILATDITRQTEFLEQFKGRLDSDSLQLSNASDRHFALQIALKCADISNPCRAWPVSRRWSQQVCQEFFKQGDYERKLGLPITPLCNRETTTVAKIQMGFMKFVVMPLFTEWRRFTSTSLSKQMLDNVERNEQRWQSVEAGIEEVGNDEDDVRLPSRPFGAIRPSAPKDTTTTTTTTTSSGGNSSGNSSSNSSGNSTKIQTPSSVTPSSPSPPPLPFLPRRHSMPKVVASAGPPSLCHRRHSLPVVTISRSLEKLSEKLAMIAECLPGGSSHSNGGSKSSVLDGLRPNITQLGRNADDRAREEGSAAGTFITSAHGLGRLLGQTILPPVASSQCRRASMPYDSVVGGGGGGGGLISQQRLAGEARRHSEILVRPPCYLSYPEDTPLLLASPETL